MYAELFPKRISELRNRKGVSARDMSISLGQNPGYINNIESGKALPSMSMFFKICEYLHVQPKDFFDTSVAIPIEFADNLKKLSQEDFNHIAAIVQTMATPPQGS